MNRTFDLFAELPEPHIEMLFVIAREQKAAPGDRILEEGQTPDGLYVLLSGRVDLVSGTDDTRIAGAGPGEILGDIAFLEDRSATLSAVAAEESLLLTLPRESLLTLLSANKDLATRFYRALAVSALRRLEARSDQLRGLLAAPDHDSLTSTGAWRELSAALEEMRVALRDAERAAISNDGVVPDAPRRDARSKLDGFMSLLQQQLGDALTLPEPACRALGARVQAELLPHVLMSESGERWYSKPRNYAGDYYSIELMYRNEPKGLGRLGPLVDQWLLERPSVRAVRNRRDLLAREIAATLEINPAPVTQITTLASGPATEIFDVYAVLDRPNRLEVHLLDIDLQALSFVFDRLNERNLQRHVQLHNSNLVYLSTGRAKLDIPPQHLVYSIGLIDYFDDRFVVKLLDFVHGLLAPGGRVILGNFHPRNPDRCFMEHVLEWPLIHRDEADMNRLFAASRFGEPCSRILFEEQQINLFAEGIRRS